MNEFKTFFSIIILVSGISISNHNGWFQLKCFGQSIKHCLSFKSHKPEHYDSKGITPFQALATALGGSIGTANIAGVAGAIIIGGPGSIFWMWAAAIVGMGVKYAEIVLALKYRERSADGYVGGAMLYIEKGLGKRSGLIKKLSKPLALVFAVFGIPAALIGTTLVQSNTIAQSTLDLFGNFSLTFNPFNVKLICGIVVALLVGIVVLGGVRRIGRASEIIVPFMAAAYIIISVIAMIKFRRNLPRAIASIFTNAFGLKQVAGGAVGYTVLRCLRTGIARGIYSNEAGIGSAPMAHACASTKDPVEQGMYGIFEVFVDTILICSMTAFVLLSSGIEIPYGNAEISGTLVMLDAFSVAFPRMAVSIFLTVSTALFAYTSILGWSVYGLQCAKYLFGSRIERPYSIIYTLFCIIGAVSSVKTVWMLGETFNFLMAVPNLTAVMLLLNEVVQETKGYSAMELKRTKK